MILVPECDDNNKLAESQAPSLHAAAAGFESFYAETETDQRQLVQAGDYWIGGMEEALLNCGTSGVS
jgi:hypothetical protein